ncbi:hypothetical protein JXA80_00020 [bacterium]|nr:hypothetical protein [candidate division CSSED10-310 bacterium]
MKRSIFLVIVLFAVFIYSVSAEASREDIFFEDFESGDGGLFGTLDWEWGSYAWVGGNCYGDNYPPQGAYSGTHMWGTVLAACYSDLGNNSGYDTCVNGNPSDDSTLTLTVDLTGYSDATLSFYEWFDLFLNWDWAEVYVNGTVVFQHCGSGFVPPSGWVYQSIDLTPFTGNTATIEFHMMTSTVVNHAGWYIDDLRVSTGSATPTPGPTATPEPTATPVCINDGDVTLDNEITAADAQLAFLIALSAYSPSFEEACAADCNGNDEITAGDAQQIFLTALGSATCVDPI